MDEIVLQSIIGTSKRNPLLSLCRVYNTNKLQIYYGAQLLETVVDDKTHISFRAAVGRLYNAGLKRSKLVETFGVDRKTMQRWGEALLMDSAEESVKALRARGGHRKVTLEIRRFTEVRFEAIYPVNRYSYSKIIREEIEEVFGKRISSETLRPIFNACKRTMGQEKRHEKEVIDCESTTGDEDEEDVPEQPDSLMDKAVNRRLSHDAIETTPNQCPCNHPGIVRFLHHAGIIIFSHWFDLIASVHTKGALLKQWLATVLLEAVNVEQSKYINFESLSMLLGKTYRSTVDQRQILGQLADDSSVSDDILALNANCAGVAMCDDYYYDPHTKHYTGIRTILKGWCASIRWADKALHCDYLHTVTGYPVYVEHADNYDDLRERFEGVVVRFRKVAGVSPERILTVVMDRGIYGKEVFERVKNDTRLELVTWEKGYKQGQFDRRKSSGSFILHRTRNHCRDIREYTFDYIDQRWSKDSTLRQIIVWAVNPKGVCIELAILSTALNRDAKELIRMMFNRWLQENDFKYLDKHYGIKQITGYGSISYEHLASQLDDKEINNAEYKAYISQRKQCEKELKHLLHREHKAKNTLRRSQKELMQIELDIEKYRENKSAVSEQDVSLEECLKKRRALKAVITRMQNLDLSEQKCQCDSTIEQLNEKLEQSEKHVSRLNYLVEQGYQRLDVRKKKVMDSVKIFARNIFYSQFMPFRESYNNFRDDHEYFRNLTHAAGFWVESDTSIEIYLEPSAYLPPKIEKCFRQILEEIQQNPLRLPDGSGRTVVVKLNGKEGIRLAVA